MLIHPMPNPIAFSLGPLAVHWYGLMYLLAFAQFIALGRIRIRQPHIAAAGWKKEDLDDMLFYGVLGVVIGGRLGEVLFYHPAVLLLASARNLRGLERRHVVPRRLPRRAGRNGAVGAQGGRKLMDVIDFIAPMVPLGYAAGRIGNFINAELPGRVADPSLPWAMIWPNVDSCRAILRRSTRRWSTACCCS